MVRRYVGKDKYTTLFERISASSQDIETQRKSLILVFDDKQIFLRTQSLSASR